MSSVARRYAKALFGLARDGDALAPTAEALDRLVRVAAEPGLGELFRSPLLGAARRTELVESIARELALPDLMTRFVRLLADRHRLGEIESIGTHFQRMFDDAMGRVRITVRTARPLDAAQEARIVATFGDLTGKQVLSRVIVDPDLLGGVVVDVAGKVYDGSLRMHFARLAKQIAATGSL